MGHVWVGVDISKSMLDVAAEREVEGDLVKILKRKKKINFPPFKKKGFGRHGRRITI